MSNPYQSPHESGVEAVAPRAGGYREKLRRVAKYQRWVLFALLLNIIVNIVALMAREQPLATNLGILALAVAIFLFATVAIYLLATELMNVGLAILCGVLMFVPCISLITLVVVNQKATGYLQQHGIHVGLMGANPNRI